MPFIEFTAGWLAGATGVVIGHPLDLVKARLQTGTQYHSIVNALSSIARKEGTLGLFKGMWAPCVSIGFINSILFAGYGATLRFLHPGELNVENRKDLPMSEIIFASTVGTVIQLVPAIPTELIKTRLQVQQEGSGHLLHKSKREFGGVNAKGRPLYNGPLDLIRQVWKAEGIRGLYKGGSVMATRDIIGYFFYIPVYEGMTKVMHRRGHGEFQTQLLSGGTAGALGWLSICPIEVVKNRVQVTPGLSARDACLGVWREGGARGFLKGSLTMGIRGFVTNACLFVVYENIVKLINRSF